MCTKIGIIDIGSNSVRLLLAEVGKKNSIRIINELKEYVRLGDGLDKDNVLSEEKMELGIKTLQTYKNICDAFKVSKITAVATEAVRRATNRDVFLNKTKEIGLNIRVLTGLEEAYYDYFSAINTMHIDNALLMDIGGASTEIILVKNRELVNSISFPFGAITLTERFETSEAISSRTENELTSYLKSNLETLPWLKEAIGFPLIGIGGSIRTAAKIHKKAINYPLNLLHNYELKYSDIVNIYENVKCKNNAQRKKIKGLSSDRADIFVGAATLIKTLMEFCSIKDIKISRNGIREGLLYSNLCEDKKPIEDILSFSIENILINHNMDINHPNHIYKLFKSLYAQLNTLIDSTISLDNIIKTSAMLHDIGSNITYYFHHKHSLYMILNSQIYGLTHKELVMSACIAANHRDDSFPLDYQDYKCILDKEDLIIIRKLGVLLKICENLDKSMTYKVKALTCDIKKDSVIINTDSSDNAFIEIKEASNCSDAFKDIFNKKLYVV